MADRWKGTVALSTEDWTDVTAAVGADPSATLRVVNTGDSRLVQRLVDAKPPTGETKGEPIGVGVADTMGGTRRFMRVLAGQQTSTGEVSVTDVG